MIGWSFVFCGRIAFEPAVAPLQRPAPFARAEGGIPLLGRAVRIWNPYLSGPKTCFCAVFQVGIVLDFPTRTSIVGNKRFLSHPPADRKSDPMGIHFPFRVRLSAPAL